MGDENSGLHRNLLGTCAKLSVLCRWAARTRLQRVGAVAEGMGEGRQNAGFRALASRWGVRRFSSVFKVEPTGLTDDLAVPAEVRSQNGVMLVAGAQAAVLGTGPALRSGSPWAAMLCGGQWGEGVCATGSLWTPDHCFIP